MVVILADVKNVIVANALFVNVDNSNNVINKINNKAMKKRIKLKEEQLNA